MSAPAVKWILLSVVAAIAGAANAAEPLSIKGLDREQTVQYVNGVGIALAYYDFELLQAGKERLYCVPDGEFGPRLIWRLASGVLEGPHEKEVIVIAALDELRKRYPCK